MAHIVAKLNGIMNKLVAQARPPLEKFRKYAIVELTPPSPGDFSSIRQDMDCLIKSARGGFKEVTVREAWLNSLVTMEVIFWFFMGECIGKRHIVGYDV